MKFTSLLLSLCLLLCACQPSGGGDKAGSKRQRPVHLVEVLDVRAEVVAPRQIRSGTLAAERLLRVSAREDGVLLELPWHPGDGVAKGQRLYRQDDALLRSDLARAEAGLAEAEQNLRRVKRLRTSKSVSEEQLLGAETAAAVARADVASLRLRVGYTQLEAPFDGVVSERLAEPGESIAVRQPLLTLLDLDTLVAEVSLSERLLARLSVGDPVQVRIDALGEQEHAARIVRIHPQIDPISRQGTLEIRLEPVPTGALPGQLVRVAITPRAESRLMVPFSALRSDAEGEYLYLHIDGKAVRRAVRSGVAVGQRVSIVEGLAEGDQVIVRGLLDLRPGKAVEVAGRATEAAP